MRVPSLILAVTSLFCLEILGFFLKERPSSQQPLDIGSTLPLKSPESPLQLNLTTVRGSGERFSSEGIDQLGANSDSLYATIRLGYKSDGSPGEVFNFLLDTGSDLTWVAKAGYAALPGLQAPPLGTEITATFPIAQMSDRIVIDEKEWTTRYGPYGAKGRTMTINVGEFAQFSQKKAAFGLADAVTYKRRGFESGLLGLNIASTIKGWPGTKGAYSPLWLQLLDDTKLPKVFAIRLQDGAGRRTYTGRIEVGGRLIDPANGGIAPTTKDINMPLIPAKGQEQADWRVRAQFLKRPQNGDPDKDTPIDKNPIEVVLDTGATYLELPETIANAYNEALNGVQVPPPPGQLVNVPCSPQGVPLTGPDLVLNFLDSGALKKKIVIPAAKLVDGPYPNNYCVSLVRASGPEVNLVGMPFFHSVEKTIFDQGGSLGKPSLTTVPR